MRHIGFLIFGVTMALALGAYALPDKYSQAEAANMTRVCIPVSGHTTALTTTASAGTSRLDQQTVYRISCTEDAYWEMGDGSAPTADSNSNYIGADTAEYFATGPYGTSDFLSAVKVTTNGVCYVHKCR